MEQQSLSLYKEHRVIVWGTGYYGAQMVGSLQYLGYEVFACCDNEESKWGKTFRNVPIISPQALKELNKDNLLLQLAVNGTFEQSIVQQLKAMKIQNYRSFPQGIVPLIECLEIELKEKYPEMAELIAASGKVLKNWYPNEGARRIIAPEKGSILVLQPPKTGDNTIIYTCKKNKIPVALGFHSPTKCHQVKSLEQVQKVVVAVRDPLARDISDAFQVMSNSLFFLLTYFSEKEIDGFLNEYQSQPIYDTIIGFRQKLHQNPPCTFYQSFFHDFDSAFLEVRNYPFHQEKGYTIIKEGNLDIFIYQLEQLNDLVPELSQWMGVPFTELEIANVASDKWIAPHYKAGQKELQFSKEYMDAIYEDCYVKHFYSQEQIMKMRKKWEKNIKGK